MKTHSKLLIFFLLLTTSFSLSAQVPEGMNYQAIARDAQGKLLTNKSITVKCIVLKGASASNIVYTETHTVTTNAFGHFAIIVGKGSSSDNFSAIQWKTDKHHLKVEVDEGSGFVVIGTSELQTVPYAMHSKTADSVSNFSANASDLKDVNTAGVTAGQVLKWDGSQWVPGNDNGGSSPSITAGTGLSLSGTTMNAKTGDPIWNANKIQGNDVATGVLVNGQVLTWDGVKWIGQTLPAPTTYSAGTGLTLSGTTFSANSGDGIWNADKLKGINFDTTGLKVGQVITYNGTRWVPQNIPAPPTYSAGSGLTLTGTTFSADSNAAIWNANKLQGIDFDTTGLKVGQVIYYDGTNWVTKGDLYTAGKGIELSGNSIIAKADDTIWNASQLNGSPLDLTKAPKSNEILRFDGTNWTPAGLDTLLVWTKNGTTGDIKYTDAQVGVGNDITEPFTAFHVQDSSFATGTGFNIMTENFMKANPSLNPIYVAQRSVVIGNGGLNHRGVMNIAAGTGHANAFFIGSFSSATGAGARNTGVFGDVQPGATGQSTGVIGTVNSASTFNIGLLGVANRSNANTNYGVYAIGDSAGTDYAGYFVGDVNYTGTLTNVSDSNLKYNVQNLPNATQLLMQLEPKTYYYKQDSNTSSLNLAEGLQYGFVAQELEAILPALVKNQVHMKGVSAAQTGEKYEYKAVNYIGLIPVLTQTIKEQQQKIEELEAKLQTIKDLEARMLELEKKMK